MRPATMMQKVGCPWCGNKETEICVTAVAWLRCMECTAENGQHVSPTKEEKWEYSDDPLPQRVITELSELWDERNP